MLEFSREFTCWKIILGKMTDSVIIPDVDTILYVVLSKGENVSYGKVIGTTECIKL
jgi:hypothetical protein